MEKILIANRQCDSEICPHRKPHSETDYCHDGQCRYAPDCRCIDHLQMTIATIIPVAPEELMPDVLAGKIMELLIEMGIYQKY